LQYFENKHEKNIRKTEKNRFQRSTEKKKNKADGRKIGNKLNTEGIT
jgi:hypothetical protein